MRKLSNIGLMAFLGLLSLNALRLWVGETILRDAVSAAVGHKPLGQVHERAETVKRLVPEDARPFLLLGQEFLAAAQAGETAGREALMGMSRVELAASVRRNPADGAAWLALALNSAPGDPAARLAEKAVRRRPGFAENAWVYARSLTSGSEEQARAYRLTTSLEPRLTPKVVEEIRLWAPDVTAQTRYVARLASCYRYWAWSVTSAVDGPLVAQWGLQLQSGSPAATRIDHAWLAYYRGLGLSAGGRPVESLPWFEKALDGVATEHAFYRNYGFALLKSGNPGKAAAEFRSSIELFPDLANAAHLGLAQSNEALGEKASAAAIYRRLASNPRIEAWVRAEAGGGIYRIEKLR